MTNPQPNPPEPSREQVQEIMRQVMLMSCAGFAKWHLTELHRETEKLRGEVETWAGRASQYVTDEQTHGGTHKELSDRIAALEAKCAEKDRALNTVLSDFKKWGECRANFSEGEFTQDYTTRRELINKALTTTGNTLLERVKGYEGIISTIRTVSQMERAHPSIKLLCDMVDKCDKKTLTTEAKG